MDGGSIRRPLTALLIAPEFVMRDAIHRGTKTISIREGWRDYQVGDTLLIGCHVAPWAVLAKITECRHTTVGGTPIKELQEDGFKDRNDFLDQMKRFGPRYEHMDMDSPITIVRWRLVEDNYWVKNQDLFDEHEVTQFLG